MFRRHGGARGDSRSSALWGTGNRGGEHRSSALWGTGNRGGEHRSRGSRSPLGLGSRSLTTLLALVAFALPLGATAAPGKKRGPDDDGRFGASAAKHEERSERDERRAARNWVAGDVLDEAKRKEKVRVIIRSDGGVSGAENAYRGLGVGRYAKRLGLVEGIAVELPARVVERLQQIPGLTVTLDAPVRPSFWGTKFSNRQMWPHEASNSMLWGNDEDLAARMPAIAVVDSGIESGRADFAGRILADVKINQPDAGDSRGHGTFVAGIAAGAGSGRAGAAPVAPIVSLDVMDDKGMAYVSDVIAASEWILENKEKYNIRVANFSLHSARASSIRWDPLNAAVEKLWFNGIVVVAAAGNYGKADGPSGVVSAPGNDPFVITVGAVDIGRSFSLRDDSVAYWSAWGYTLDGFAKPELGAPGRYMIGPVPQGSTLAAERAEKVVSPGYIELSGTSFAAPVVAGAAAQILARRPEWTPGQVKGALMLTARPVPGAEFGAAGVGQITVVRAATLRNPPDANAALMPFVTSDGSGGLAFDAAAWGSVAQSSAAWASAAWSSAAWSSAAWSSAAWASAAWADAAWADAAWSSAAWSSAAWADQASEDNADDGSTGGVMLTEEEQQALLADPALALSADENAFDRLLSADGTAASDDDAGEADAAEEAGDDDGSGATATDAAVSVGDGIGESVETVLP